MRITVHDEVMGDLDPKNALKVVELLNDVVGVKLPFMTQRVSVPFQWEMEMSQNWAMTSPDTMKVFKNVQRGGKELCSLKQFYQYV
jgi:hypothetical protein